MGGSDNGEAVAARMRSCSDLSRAAVATRAAAAATGLAAMNQQAISVVTRHNKIIYSMPAVGGLNASIGFADAGATSEADETSTGRHLHNANDGRNS